MNSKKSLITWKKSNYFWNTCKELIQKKKKKLYIQSSLPELFLKNTASEPLFQTLLKNRLRSHCFPTNFANSLDDCFWVSQWYVKSILKCAKNENYDILITYLLVVSFWWPQLKRNWIITCQFTKEHVRIKLSHLNVY